MSNETPNSAAGEKGKIEALKERAIEEFRHFIALFLYLWILLGLFVLNQQIILRQQGADFIFHGFALLNALVLAKVMLVFEDLELARWLKGRPAVLSILFEAAFCTALLMAFHVVERVAVGLFHGGELAKSLPSFGGGGLAGLLIVSLILFVSLLPFFAFKNVARAIGSVRMKDILFRRHERKGDPSS